MTDEVEIVPPSDDVEADAVSPDDVEESPKNDEVEE